MADASVTTASVSAYSNARKHNGTAGEALTIGVGVYRKAGDKRWYLSDTDAVEADAIAYGITLTAAAAAGQPVQVQYGGDINPGFTVTVAGIYVVGEAAGGIALVADLESGEYLRILGVGITASKLRLLCFNPGVAKP